MSPNQRPGQVRLRFFTPRRFLGIHTSLLNRYSMSAGAVYGIHPVAPRLGPTEIARKQRSAWLLRAVANDALLPKLPDYLRPVATFSYYSGWRAQSEPLCLKWGQVDLESGAVRLYRGTTKNNDGRLIKLPEVLRQVLEQQWHEHLTAHPECEWVFHKNGARLFSFYKAWRRACREAGLSGKLCHDFRRTAVGNLVRAGVPERVAMTITGHKTRDVFDRYNIVSDTDLDEAARLIDQRIASRTMTKTMTADIVGPHEHSLSH